MARSIQVIIWSGGSQSSSYSWDFSGDNDSTLHIENEEGDIVASFSGGLIAVERVGTDEAE